MSKIDNFPYPTPIPAKIWGCSLCSRFVMLVSAESEKVRLISHEITFAVWIPSRYFNVTDRQTDGRTSDNLPWQYRATRMLRAVKSILCRLYCSITLDPFNHLGHFWWSLEKNSRIKLKIGEVDLKTILNKILKLPMFCPYAFAWRHGEMGQSTDFSLPIGHCYLQSGPEQVRRGSLGLWPQKACRHVM